MSTATLPQPPAPSAATGETVIRAANLTKIFRDFWMRPKARAVDGISFEVRPGEVFGLLGPNGSGKSTTIKLILCLLHPTGGKVFVFGKRTDDVATKKRIGYLPEESYLYRFLNARETLDYYGRLFHLDHHQRRQRIDRLLDMVGLAAVQRRPIGEYSKGMQRRIGLAQALINDPDLLILDEPTTGMDPIGTKQIKDLIVELSRRGKTIVLCTHLLADVEDVCDRVAVMFGGRIRAMDTVDGLLTVQDKMLIETSTLDPDTVQQVERLLEARGKHIERVEQPRQRLEALFLDIVNRAQAEGADTSGARAGGAIADFLTGGKPAEGEAIIAGLVEAAAPPPAPVPAPAAAPEPAEPKPDESLLTDLLGRAPAPAPAPQAPTTEEHLEAPPTPEELEIISQLGSQWTNKEDARPPQPRQAAGSGPEDHPKAVPGAAKPGEDEHADTSFLDALTQVPEYEDKDKKGEAGHGA